MKNTFDFQNKAGIVSIMLLVSWFAFSIGNFWMCTVKHHQSIVMAAILVCLPFLFIIPFFMNKKRFDKIRNVIDEECAGFTVDLEAFARNRPAIWIAIIACSGMYAELMIIRAHSSYFQLFAYFKNISLLSCFLGLGIGYTRGDKRPVYLPLVIPMLALQIGIMHFLRSQGGTTDMLNNPIKEVFMFGMGQVVNGYELLTSYGFMAFIFVVNTLLFIPLGHAASFVMQNEKKLEAYGWNLAGSLIGILGFSVISFLWAPPCVWIGLIVTGLSLMFINKKRILALSIVAGIFLVCLTGVPSQINKAEIYSPYQLLALKVENEPYPTLEVSNVYYQRILNLTDENVNANKSMLGWREYYDLPYKFKNSPADVLVVGSGTGNDAASAVRNGAGNIDAVEIDPAILKLGTILHPEQPYKKSNVTSIVDDARSFMRHTKKKYDLIVYGLLDSHTLLASRSGVRLDSYVYTVEGLRQARARLKDDGIICLSFSLIDNVMGIKLYRMIKEAFDGKEPRVYKSGYDAGFTFVIGENLESINVSGIQGVKDITGVLRYVNNNSKIAVNVSTDDWPFFYMPKRTYPVSYLNMLMILLAISMTLLMVFTRKNGAGFSLPCFFLGAGFMLIETKGITELALVYGSTWMVVSAVIAGILIMAYLANLAVIRMGKINKPIVYSLLGLTILAGFFTPAGSFGNMNPLAQKVIMTVLLTLPLFCSGFAFSAELTGAKNIQSALSANLLGAMVGGIVEYNSMFFGFKALYIFAIVLYAAAYFTSRKGN